MKDSEILREAKTFLSEGRHTYICLALEEIGRTYLCTQQITSLRAWVLQMLGERTNPWVSYETWCWRKKHHFTPEQTQQGRLAWLDWMITYCEAEENK